jgi:hypothetical protein
MFEQRKEDCTVLRVTVELKVAEAFVFEVAGGERRQNLRKDQDPTKSCFP